MKKAILTTKVGMTQVFGENGVLNSGNGTASRSCLCYTS